MSRKLIVTAARDRRRAGLKFKAGQKTPVELPDDDEEAEALMNTLVADPVLQVLPGEEDDETETSEPAPATGPVSGPVSGGDKPARSRATAKKPEPKSTGKASDKGPEKAA